MSDSLRFSPVDAALARLQPTWGEVQGMRVASRFAEASLESEKIQSLALCDVSALAKFGLKGPAAGDWIRDHGVDLPEGLHGWKNLEAEGGVIIQSDRDEFFLEESCGGSKVRDLVSEFGPQQAGAYRIERNDAGFLLSGDKVSSVILQTCGYDFSSEESGYILTRVAGVSAAILHFSKDAVPVYRIWVPPSFAIYLWNELATIVDEAGGSIVGFDTVKGYI